MAFRVGRVGDGNARRREGRGGIGHADMYLQAVLGGWGARIALLVSKSRHGFARGRGIMTILIFFAMAEGETIPDVL